MSIQVIRQSDLKPFWGSTNAGVAGHGRWIVTPVGGPEGYLHMNRDDPGAVTTESCTGGLIVLPSGVSSPGLHVHKDFDEIYVVVSGRVAAIGPDGKDQHLGEMDWVWIPRGTNHGLRNAGFNDARVIYFQTGVERAGFQTGEAENLGGSSWLLGDSS